jgi:hypothetical protein
MKPLLLTVGVLSFSVGFSQTPDDKMQELLQKLNAKPSITQPVLPGLPKSDNTFTVLSGANRVYILPQDNMPCVTPQISHYNMPNLADNRYNPKFQFDPNGIPNPALPPEVIKPVLPPYKILEKKNK